MKKIDTTKFRAFHLYDESLFIVDMGTKLDKAKMTEKTPTINFVGRGNVNNGVTAFIDKIDGVEPYKAGCMTVAMGGFLGSCFIQDKDFYTSQNVCVLIPRQSMSIYCKRYIATMIYKEGTTHYKPFIDELNRHIRTDFKILLPIDANGNPDWAYMEEYMKALERRVTCSVAALNTLMGGGKHKQINVSNWQYFKVGILFEIHPTKAYKLTNAQLLDNGQYPVVVNSAFNNGVGGYSSQIPTEQGNMITFSDTVDANTIFYQAEKFVGYPHVQGLYPLSYKEQWTANSLKFFASVFRKAALTKGFDYGNKFRRDIATEIEIKLPTTANGDPDFEYMEQYMLNVENKVKGTLKQIA